MPAEQVLGLINAGYSLQCYHILELNIILSFSVSVHSYF